MTVAPAPLHEIGIEAPDGAAALELERRLAHLSPTTVAHGSRWFVDLVAPRPEELEVVVRDWLGEIGSATTTMTIDGRATRVSGRPAAARRPHRATHRSFIG